MVPSVDVALYVSNLYPCVSAIYLIVYDVKFVSSWIWLKRAFTWQIRRR